MLHRLAELTPGLLKRLQIRALDPEATKAGGIDSLESIPGLLKSLKIPSLPAGTTNLFLLGSWPP
jgi:hypothetical protein